MCKHSEGWYSIGVNELGNWVNCRQCETTRIIETGAKPVEIKVEKVKLKLVVNNDVKGVVTRKKEV